MTHVGNNKNLRPRRSHCFCPVQPRNIQHLVWLYYLSSPWCSKGVGKGDVWVRGLILERDDSSLLNRQARLNRRPLANREMSQRECVITATSVSLYLLHSLHLLFVNSCTFNKNSCMCKQFAQSWHIAGAQQTLIQLKTDLAISQSVFLSGL